jgi:protoheme IX farnesyltransferase
MRRTAKRPLPAGRLKPAHALLFGVVISILGALQLWLDANLLASVLAVLTLLSYLLIYTPLKKRTAWCTFVGAFPGAMPPVIGWAAARGSLAADAWILFAFVFFWQFPHLLSIAWLYRDDYRRVTSPDPCWAARGFLPKAYDWHSSAPKRPPKACCESQFCICRCYSR